MEVRSVTKRQLIQRYIAQGRLLWFGHLLRPLLNHPAHAIYTFNLNAEGWSRPVEPLAHHEVMSSAKDHKQLGTTLLESSNIALDRSRWRSNKVFAHAVSTPSWQGP